MPLLQGQCGPAVGGSARYRACSLGFACRSHPVSLLLWCQTSSGAPSSMHAVPGGAQTRQCQHL